MINKRNLCKRIISILTVVTIIVPTFTQFAISAEEADKYPYNIFGRNGIEINAGNLCINGDVHTNKEADITAYGKNINGKITTGNDIEKRFKHVYADTKIREKYFTENCELFEDGYVKSEMNIHINSPIFSYRNIELDGNVALNSNMGTLMNINVTGEVKNANTSVVYSKYGNITIENDSTANINGLIYAPLGTLTINSPNVSINGVIIADKIIINGNSINLNGNDNIARFIGTQSEVYDFSDLEYLPKDWLGDTDEDILFDIYEKVIDTDPFNPDTDGDKLPDGYEVLTLNTDPLEVDTDENGISDADEDFDNDNLNNLGEYENKTEPFNPDTDDDGLLDGDEITKYKTDPLNPDTDNDGLLDGEEGYDGTIYKKYEVYFDPLNPDTNGNGILDGDEMFGQTKKQNVETHDKAITEIKVNMSTNGNLERNLKIESMYGIDAMSSDVYAMIGEPFNFETSTKFNAARITFKIDQSKLGDTEFDNLIILWYNEKEQIFEEMPTTRNRVQSTISTKTTHFSQYIVVDSAKWYANWEKSFTELRKMWSSGTTTYKSMNTVFIVDCSSDMSKGDSRISICRNIMNNMMTNDKAAVITYASGINSATGFMSPQSALANLESNISNFGVSSSLIRAFNKAMNLVYSSDAELNRIIIVTTSNSTFTFDLDEYNFSGVNVNVIDLGDYSMGLSLFNVTQLTGGGFYNAITADALTYQKGEEIYTPPQFIGEDSDGDTIPDIVEDYGLKPNGQPIGTNKLLKDTDGDGLDDNVELRFSVDNFKNDMDNDNHYYCRALYLATDPTKKDTDGDGLLDGEDPKPLSTYNNGENIVLTSGLNGTLSQLQRWLNALGYSNISSDDMGQNYGPVTRTAVYIYQINHSFKTTSTQNGKETALEYIDDLTYATIANDYANKFGNGENDYYNYVNGISNKPYFSNIRIIKPQTTPQQDALGITITQKNNSIIKNESGLNLDLYFYDYTNPINQILIENVLYLYHYAEILGSSTSDSSVQDIIMYEFFDKVRPNGDWDYKVKDSWDNQIEIPYMSISFPFILRDDFCSSEKFGNVNYGYVGNAIGFSEKILIGGGHVVSLLTGGHLEDSSDLNNVRKGFDYFMSDIQ
mgnify:CR=1 FL=1